MADSSVSVIGIDDCSQDKLERVIIIIGSRLRHGPQHYILMNWTNTALSYCDISIANFSKHKPLHSHNTVAASIVMTTDCIRKR